MHLIEFVNVLYYLINCPSSKLVWRSEHLYRERAHPLQVNDACDVPLIIDKEVATMKIRKLKYVRSTTTFPLNEMV
jgi:hypothetical protein